MNTNFLQQVAAELNNAYRHFGDYDDMLIKQNIDTWITRLKYDSETPKEFVLEDKEVIAGVAITVASREMECTTEFIDKTEYVKTHTEAIILVVGNESMNYVVEEYDSYEAVASDETKYANFQHSKRKLGDISGKYCTIWP